MDGDTDKSRRRRTPKVERIFGWSRLENQLITAAYEQVLPPITRSTRGHECEVNGGGRASGGHLSQVQGA